MGEREARVRFTKKNLTSVPLRSGSLEDTEIASLHDAFLTASRLTIYYENYIHKERQSGNKPMIMPRDATQILYEMRNQRVYICEEEHSGGTVVHAASMLWDEEIPVPSQTSPLGFDVGRFLEIGTQMSLLPGFNLQWTLTAVTLLEQFLLDPTGVPYTAIYGDNHPSEHNFLKNMHFSPWHSVPPTVERLRLHFLEEGGQEEIERGVKWFRPTLKALNESAVRIVDLIDNPKRKAKLTNEHTAGSSTREMHFTFDESQFQAIPLADIVLAARDIAKAQPDTFGRLRMFASRTLSEGFLQFSDQELG